MKDNRYTIELINNKYMIFDNQILQFLSIKFDTYKLAESYINTSVELCNIMCE